MPERSADEIFNDALQRHPDEWPDFLDEACAGDRALRAEVASLLAVFQRYPPPVEAASDDSLPDRVGRYPILGEIGRGGMGRVLLAEDPVLGRRVALKMLAARRVDGTEPFARFRREAQILASLNHPNIATLYSLEQVDGDPFLTMELVPGESIAARIAALPPGTGMDLRQVVQLGLQMARALEAAHERGIVHRDLKPANVIVTDREEVKLLDFGVAKILSGESGGRPEEHEGGGAGDPTAVRAAGSMAPPTGPVADRSEDSSVSPPDAGPLIGARESIGETVPGGVLGSPGYMSPEQLQGQSVGPSSDIWALGCVLFECLSGRPAFPGATPLARAQATRSGGPDWSVLPPQMSSQVGRLLRACLTTDRAERISTARQLRRELEAIAADLGMTVPPGSREAGPSLETAREAPREAAREAAGVMGGAVDGAMGGAMGDEAGRGASIATRPMRRGLRPRAFRRRGLLGLALAVLVGGAGTTLLLRQQADRVPSGTTGAGLGGLRQVTFVGDVDAFDLSPDDRQVAYTNNAGALVLQDLAKGTQRVIREATRLADPIWSPDGARILVSAEAGRQDWGVCLVSLPEETVTPIGPDNCRGMGWTPDGGAIVGTRLDRAGRNRRWILIDAGTGDTSSVPLGVDGHHFHGLRYSPDGRSVVVWGTSQEGKPAGWIMDRLGQPARRLSLARDPSWFGWSRDGREVHALTSAQNGSWLERLRLPRREDETMTVDGSVECKDRLRAFAGFRRSDRAVYSIATGLSTLWMLERGSDGEWSRRRLLAGTPELTHPRLSPEGRRVVTGRVDGDRSEVVVLSLSDGSLLRYDSGPPPVRWTSWSPDGKSIVYQSGDGAESRLYRLEMESGASEPLSNEGCHGYVYWFPDRRIRYQTIATADQDYTFLDPEAGSEERLFPGPSRGTVFQSSVSPDGEWVVVSGNRNGLPGVALWLVRMSDRSERLLWAERSAPIGWSHDGRSVFAVRSRPDGARDDMERQEVVSIDRESGVVAPVAELPEGFLVYWSDVDITPAGDRIVVRIARAGADLWLAERPVQWR